MARRRGFIFGDMHFPWVDREALRLSIKALKSYSPDYVVQIGDLYDYFSCTRFARSHNVYTPRAEIQRARAMANEFWDRVYNACPKAKLYQISGNHDMRPAKKILESAPELEDAVEMFRKKLFTFDGVHSIYNQREELRIDDVIYIHGHHSRLGAHMMELHENVVCGHTHKGGSIHHPWGGSVKFELNAGFLADRHAPALRYTMYKKFSKWTLGFGKVDEHGGRFCPLG